MRAWRWGAWRQGQDCSLAEGAAGRAVFRAGVIGASEGGGPGIVVEEGIG